MVRMNILQMRASLLGDSTHSEVLLLVRCYIVVAVFLLGTSVYSQTTIPPQPNPAVPAPKTKTAKPKKPPITRTFETQLSGFTSEDAESLFARLSMQETRAPQNWYIRGSFNRTATKNGVSSRVTTQRFDTRIEHMRPRKDYTVWTGVLSRRDRHVGKRDNTSGYHFLSYGFGRQLDPKTKGDIGLGLLDVYDEPGGAEPALIASIRVKKPLAKKLSLDCDTLILQPTGRLGSTKVDSDLGLSHELAPGLALRLGWSVTNLIRPVRSSHEWDSIIRLSISYRRTSTH